MRATKLNEDSRVEPDSLAKLIMAVLLLTFLMAGHRTFADGSMWNQITYTSSNNPLIKQLTKLFENISATLEFGRRLEQSDEIG